MTEEDFIKVLADRYGLRESHVKAIYEDAMKEIAQQQRAIKREQGNL